MSNESFEQLVKETLGKYSNIASSPSSNDTSLSKSGGEMSYDEYRKAIVKKIDESLYKVVEPHLSPHRKIEFPKQPEPEKTIKKMPEYKSPIRVHIPENTLAYRNYNPGNIRYAGQPDAAPGAGGFARFKSPEVGYDHIKRQIALDRDRGLNLSQFITKYAPPTENDTNLYIQQAISELGASPDEPLSQIDEDKLARFIAKKESGSKIEELMEEPKTTVGDLDSSTQQIIRSPSLPVEGIHKEQKVVEVSPYDDLLSNAIMATKNLLKKGIHEGDKATYTGQGIKRTRADFSDIKEDAKNVYEWLTKKRGESGIDVNIPDETRVDIEYTGQKAPAIEGLEPESMKTKDEPFNVKEYMEAQAGSKGEAEVTKPEGPSAPFLVPPPEKFVESGDLKPGPPETIPELKELNEADRRSTLANAKIAAERGVEYADLMTDWYLASVGLAKEKPLYDREEKLYQKMINDPIKGETYLEESLYGAAGMAPAMLKGSAQGMALAGMTALATGGWGAPLVGGAYMAGAAQYWYRMGTGSIYSSMRKEGIDPNIASPLAQVMGVPYAIIEFMQSKRIAYDPAGIHNKIVVPAIRQVIARALKQYGVDLLHETGEEIGQEIVEMATVEMGKAIQNYITDAGIEHTSLGEVVSRLVDVTVQSAGSLAIMMGPKRAVNTIGEIASAEEQKSIVRDGVKQFRKAEDVLRKERNKLLTIPASERAESQAIQDNLKKYEEGIADLKVAREKYTKAAKEQLEKGIVRLGNIGVSGDKITIDGKKINKSEINNIIGLPQYAEVEFEDGTKKTYLDPKDVNRLLEESEKKWAEAQKKRKPKFKDVKQPPVEGTYLNIGLKVGDEVTLKTDEVVKTLEQEFGVKVLESSEHESETEPTATIKIDRDLTEEEVNKINLMFDREAVAVLSSDGKGAMIGPKSERWGEFDEEKFILPDGNTIAQERETLKEKPQKPTVATEKPVSEKTTEEAPTISKKEERARETRKTLQLYSDSGDITLENDVDGDIDVYAVRDILNDLKKKYDTVINIDYPSPDEVLGQLEETGIFTIEYLTDQGDEDEIVIKANERELPIDEVVSNKLDALGKNIKHRKASTGTIYINEINGEDVNIRISDHEPNLGEGPKRSNYIEIDINSVAGDVEGFMESLKQIESSDDIPVTLDKYIYKPKKQGKKPAPKQEKRVTLAPGELPWVGDKDAEFKYDGTEIEMTMKDDPLNVETVIVQRVKNNGDQLEVYKPGEPGETFDIDTQYWDIEVKKLKINEEEVTKEIPQKESNLKNLSDQAIINSYIDYTIEEELREMYDEEPTENPVLTEIANRIELKQDGSFNSKKAKELFGLLKGNKRLVGPVEYSEFINEIKQHYNEFVAISGKAGKIKAPEAKEAPEKKETNRVVDKNPELKWIEEKLPNKKPEKKENISEYEGEEISPQKISRKLTPKTAEKALSKVVDEHAKEKGIYGIYYDAEENKKVATNTGYLVVIPEKISGESRVVKPSTGDEIGKSFPDYKRVIEEFKPGIIAEDVDVDDLRATVEGIVRLNDFVVNGKYPIFAKVRIGGVEHYYNPKYLKNAVDALLSTGSKNIEFSFSGTEKDKYNPLIIRDKDNKNKLAIIMPVVESRSFEENIDKYAIALEAGAQKKTSSREQEKIKVKGEPKEKEPEVGKEIKQERKAPERKASEGRPTPTGGAGGGSAGGGRPGLLVVQEELYPKPGDYVPVNKYPAEEFSEEQRFAVNMILSKRNKGGKGFVLGDGTGTGKTRTEIVAAVEVSRETNRPALIITQNKQIIKGNFIPQAKSIGIDLEKENIELGTYDDLRTGKIGGREYSIIIYDEAHNLKNTDSQKTMAAQKLKGDFKVYATATPMDRPTAAAYFVSETTGEPLEKVLDRIGVRIEIIENRYGDRFEHAVLKEGFNWDKVFKNLIALRDQLAKEGALVRREYPFYGDIEKQEIAIEDEDILYEQELIDSYWQARIESARSTRAKRNFGGQRIMELSRWTEAQKINQAVELIEKEVAEGRQVIIVAEYVEESVLKALPEVELPGTLKEIGKRLKSKGIAYAKIFGVGDKSKAVEEFQEGKVNVALTTPKSGGTGIDLDDVTGHAPRTMIILTPNFSGDVFEQTLGRVSRRNTATPAKVLFLTSQNAIADNRRYEILKHKLKVLKTIQRGDDPDVAIGMFVEGENVVDAAVFDNSPGINMATRRELQDKVIDIDKEYEEIENKYKKTFEKLQASQDEYENVIETGEEEDVIKALDALREAEKEYQKYLERRQYLSEQRQNALSALMDSGGIDPFGRPIVDGVTMTYDGKTEYRKSLLEKAKDLMHSAEISRKARRLINGFLEDEEGKKYGVNTIVQHLREAIPVTIYVRKEQLKGHPGHFVRNGHFIRLLTTTDPDVNMHEIGHAIYQLYTETYGPIKKPHIQKMLLELTRELTTMASAYNLTEGFAELIRRFVVAPDSFDHIRIFDKDENGNPSVTDIAPEDMQKLVDWMLSELKEKEPGILRALVDAQAMFYAHNSREESAIEQSYYSDQPKITEFDPDIQIPWLGAVGQIFNRGHGINRYMHLIAKAMIRDGMPMKDVRAIFKHLRMQTQTDVTTALREAYHMTTRIIPESLAVVTGMGGSGVRVLEKDLTSFEYLSDMSLNDIIEIVGRENYDTFMKYVHNKAHLARINRAREKGIKYEYPGKYSRLSEPVLKKLVREVESREDGKKFIEAADKLEEFWNALLKVEERTGLITPEEYLDITGAHDYYADLHRVYAPGDENKPAGTGRVIKYVSRLGSGSSAPPGDIIENAFNRAKRVLSSYYWNLLTNAMVEFSHQIGANKDIPYAARKLANRLVTPLRMDSKIVANLSEEEQRKIIVKYLNEELLKNDPDAETLTTEDLEYMPGPLPVWRSKGPHAKYVVSYMGYDTRKRQYIQINDKYIFQTFLHEETNEALDWVSDFVKEGIDPIKQLLVKNIAFALMNPMRDMFNAAFRGKGLGAVVPGKYMAAGLLNKIMKKFPDAQVVSEMLSVSLESMYSPNQRIRENAFMNILKRGVWQEGWSKMTKEEKLKHSFGITTGAIMKPLDLLFHYIGFEYMAELFESATREGKAIEVIKNGGRMGDVFYHYDKISGSFGERSGYPVVEKVVRMAMFLNPAMQVTYDQFERLTDPIERRNATIQLFYIGMVLPAIIWALLALSRDDEEEKIYRLRPDSERMNYMYFPGGLRVPFNYGITGAMHSVIFAILDDLVLDLSYADRMKFAQAIKDRALDVPGAETMLPPPIGELRAIRSNYEPFYRSYIVPPYLATEPKTAQYYEDTPDFYKWLAWKTNSSPLMIEYFVKSALNRNYHYFLTIPKRIEKGQFTLDYFKDNPFELPFVGRMFTRTPTGHYSKPVQDIKAMADKFAARAKVERTKLEMKTGKKYGNVNDISIVRMATEDMLKEKYGDSWQQSKEWEAFRKELNSLIRVENADRMIGKFGAKLRELERRPKQDEHTREQIEYFKRRMVELALNAVAPTDEQYLDVKFLSE